MCILPIETNNGPAIVTSRCRCILNVGWQRHLFNDMTLKCLWLCLADLWIWLSQCLKGRLEGTRIPCCPCRCGPFCVLIQFVVMQLRGWQIDFLADCHYKIPGFWADIVPFTWTWVCFYVEDRQFSNRGTESVLVGADAQRSARFVFWLRVLFHHAKD